MRHDFGGVTDWYQIGVLHDFGGVATRFWGCYELDEELRVERERQEEASKVAIADMFNEVQKRIDVDYELAARMTYEEQEKYTIKERTRHNMRMLVKDTRSQDGKDDKDNDKGSKSRSQSMKEQAYNKEQRERPRPHELNDESNLIDLMKECHQ
ncbi:hypothetical protein Tco_1114978 [Tanacetum coccineum]